MKRRERQWSPTAALCLVLAVGWGFVAVHATLTAREPNCGTVLQPNETYYSPTSPCGEVISSARGLAVALYVLTLLTLAFSIALIVRARRQALATIDQSRARQ
jgi:hypothetical protein